MKRSIIMRGFLIGAVFLSVLSGAIMEKAYASEKPKTVDILATHDLHSHLDSFSVMKDGESQIVGGFARIKTLIDNKKAEKPDTLVLDAGDFSMGTLYQVLYQTEAAELSMLGELGYDATTLGNHEFDYESAGIANMFNAAVESGSPLPEMLVCNIDWSVENGNSGVIQEAFENYGGKEYVMVEKGDVKIALLGVFGKDSLACAPTCELTFLDPVESVKETVEYIEANEQADMIVCLSHSGTNEDESKSEDEILAKAVPQLDLIISGHTHTYFEEPIVHGDTYIVSVGEYGQWVGDISMTQNEDGRWDMTSYEILHVDESVDEDPVILEKLAQYTKKVDEQYLAQFGYSKEQVLMYNPYEFETSKDTEIYHEEMRIGNFMSDACVYSVNEYGENVPDVDVAVVPSGVIRETMLPGEVTVSDTYDMFSLGIGADGIIGYPMVGVYLSGAELKIVAEIDASVSDLMPSARLYLSGLNFTFNPNRILLNKVTDVYLTKDNERIEIEDDKLYYVVADMYSGQMLSAVSDVSKGILSVQPKDADGNPITDLDEAIIYTNGKELKAWQTLALYAQNLGGEDASQEMPQYYSVTQNRKVVDDSKNILDLVKNPNKFSVIIVSVVLVLAVILIVVIRCFYKLVKKILHNKS